MMKYYGKSLTDLYWLKLNLTYNHNEVYIVIMYQAMYMYACTCS